MDLREDQIARNKRDLREIRRAYESGRAYGLPPVEANDLAIDALCKALGGGK